jgi:hypothetical protein
MRHVYTVDATMESLALLAVQNPGVCVVRDELSGWIASFDAYRGGKGGDRQNMLTAWSGGPIKVDRKSGEPLFCLHPAISVTGGIQPDLLPVLANEAGKRDGFVERILYTMPDTGPLCWTEDEVDEQTTSSFMDVFNTLYHGSYHEPPDAIKLSPGAKHSWVTWHRRNQEVVAATKGLRRGIASKMPTQVARFALILHCLEHYKNPATAMISKDEMDAAIELGEYFRRHAERVLSVLGYKPLPQRPLFDERVYQAVARHAGAWVTLTALHKELCGHAPSELLRGALDRLVAEDVIEFKGGTTGPKGGRPSEAWRLSQEKGCEETEKSEETPNAASGLRNRSDGDCEETAKKPPQLRRNPLGGDESGDIGDDQASEEELEWLA